METLTAADNLLNNIELSESKSDEIKNLLKKKGEMEEKFCKHLISTAYINPIESAVYAGALREIAEVVAKDLCSRPTVQEYLIKNSPNLGITPIYILSKLKNVMDRNINDNEVYSDNDERKTRLGLKAIEICNSMLGYEKLTVDFSTIPEEVADKLIEKAKEQYIKKF